MQHYYDIVYRINSTYKFDETESNKEFTPALFSIEKMFHLFDTDIGGYDGWKSTDSTQKAVLLEQSKWGNICLMGNLKNETMQTLIGAGAEIVEKSAVYSDKIDACIQIAYMAAKANVKDEHIYEATNGLVTEVGYKKLQEIFYEDFPHKFI